MDINRNHQLWDRDPAGTVPSSEGGRGRPPVRCLAAPQTVRRSAEGWTTERFAGECRMIPLRESTRGPLRARIWAMKVWQWEPSDERARQRWLVVRQEQDDTFKSCGMALILNLYLSPK